MGDDEREGDGPFPEPTDPRLRPTEAPPFGDPSREPLRLHLDRITRTTPQDLEPPTGPLEIAQALARDPIDRQRPTMSIPPPRPAPFGPPIRLEGPPPRSPSSPGGRRPLSREPSRPRPTPGVKPVRDYPIARGLLRNPDQAPDDRPASSTVPRAFVRGGVLAPPDHRSAARAEADGMLQEMAEGLLVGGDAAGNSEIRVTLGEEFFGGTELHIVQTPEGLVAILRPPDRETYRLLAGELPRLRMQLEERGLRVSNLRVEEP